MKRFPDLLFQTSSPPSSLSLQLFFLPVAFFLLSERESEREREGKEETPSRCAVTHTWTDREREGGGQVVDSLPIQHKVQ